MSGYDSTFEPEAGEVEERRWKLRPLSQATPRQTRFSSVRRPLGFPTLIAGVGGVGKSTLLQGIAARGSVGDDPWDTIYVSFEDSAEEALRPHIEAAGGDPARVHELALTDANSLDSFSLPRDIDELETLSANAQRGSWSSTQSSQRSMPSSTHTRISTSAWCSRSYGGSPASRTARSLSSVT